VEHSIGEFGVGMKRAIFKIGRHFRVESSTEVSRFVVEHDVDEWAKVEDDWAFQFSMLDEMAKNDAEQAGTSITISRLQRDVSDSFALAATADDLSRDIQSRLEHALKNGLAITVNQIPVSADPLTIIGDGDLAPAFCESHYGKGREAVHVKIYCGVARESDSERAGWNVFCNGRKLLDSDKSPATGWHDEDDDISIPGYHNQYSLFRGCVYFDSDSPAQLPWNTTKTGVNLDSPYYRAARREMKHLMRPVLDFLNKLKTEKSSGDPEAVGPLEEMVRRGKAVPVEQAMARSAFTYVKPAKSVKSGMQRIQYDVPLEQVKKAKEALGAATFKEVGEETFKYYYQAEVE